jgi:hypothetical protein
VSGVAPTKRGLGRNRITDPLPLLMRRSSGKENGPEESRSGAKVRSLEPRREPGTDNSCRNGAAIGERFHR